MSSHPACPYFGRSEELCEMGCGPSSTHDVRAMVRYCNADYARCARYGIVRDREGLPVVQALRRDLVSQVSHAVRTPLTSIRSCSEILLRHDCSDPKKGRRFLEIIHEEAERLTRTMEELLDRELPSLGEPTTSIQRAPTA